MLKKSRPVIYTFGDCVLGDFFVVGLVTVPAILNYAQRIYFMLQALKTFVEAKNIMK